MTRAVIGRAVGLAVLVATAAQAAPVRDNEPSLDFATVFADNGEPNALHFSVRYTAADGATHSVEVWRDGKRRLRRSTDGKLELLVDRTEGSDGFTMQILDMRRRISTRIDRTNLYRVGMFTDWYDLAHGLKHPTAAYRLTAIDRPSTVTTEPVADCRWYALVQKAVTSNICWSTQARIPLVIENTASHWAVSAMDSGPISASAFKVSDAGFVRNDANQDIEKD